MSCTLPAAKNAFQPNTPTVPSVVVVDPRFDAYTSLASAAQHGLCTVHFRGSGAAALHLLSKHRADAVIVGAELDDMSRQDFVDLLGSQRFATQQAASRPVVLMADGGHSHCEHWPLSSTSRTEPMPPAADGADFEPRGRRVRSGFGVIATSTPSRHDTSPQVVQTKCGCSSFFPGPACGRRISNRQT